MTCCECRRQAAEILNNFKVRKRSRAVQYAYEPHLQLAGRDGKTRGYCFWQQGRSGNKGFRVLIMHQVQHAYPAPTPSGKLPSITACCSRVRWALQQPHALDAACSTARSHRRPG